MLTALRKGIPRCKSEQVLDVFLRGTTSTVNSNFCRLIHQHDQHLHYPFNQKRSFHGSFPAQSSASLSTVANPTVAGAESTNPKAEGSSPSQPGDEKSDKKKSNEKNLFLDNLGTVFLTVIGLIIASLVRSFYGASRKNSLRDQLEAQAALDPLEIDELRSVNPTLTVAVFRSLLRDVWDRCSEGRTTYTEFTQIIREILVKKHNVPTIEFGHLLDRVAIHIMDQKRISPDDPQSITLWMTLLSLALHAPVPDRIRALYDVLEQEAKFNNTNSSPLNHAADDDGSSSNATSLVSLDQVLQLVDFLQATDQLAMETQLIATKNKVYPIQQYHRGTPKELVPWQGADQLDVDALASILRSKSVCAWGECYSRKKFV